MLQVEDIKIGMKIIAFKNPNWIFSSPLFPYAVIGTVTDTETGITIDTYNSSFDTDTRVMFLCNNIMELLYFKK